MDLTPRIDWPRSRPATGDDGPLVCVINMSRSTERWDAIAPQLDGSGARYVRLDAFDGDLMLGDMMSISDRRRFARTNGREPGPGDLGCLFSHLAAWRFLLQTDEPRLVVLEDDAVLEPGWLDVVKQLPAATGRGTVIKLAFGRAGLSLRYGRIGAAHSLRVPLSHQANGVAYLIDRQAALNFLEAAVPAFATVDHLIEMPWLTKVSVLTVMPALAWQSGADTTIRRPEKFRRRARWQTYLRRVHSHVRRFAAGLLAASTMPRGSAMRPGAAAPSP